ncbi:MAG TPA: HDOD domain-containing protein, partial [Leptospiraceae bacterium]|nr:HDOD domain-containing protein [Leptospiraceae bacterium]
NDLKIPAIPSVMIKVLQFDANSVAGSAELEKIITPDKAISLDILKIANSSFYGRSGTVKTLKDAITLLGLKTVKNLVILQSKKQIAGSLMGSVFKKHIQDLPILTSLVAFDLTVPLNLKGLRDEIFTLTLLRRIGATIFAMNFSKRYQDVIKLAEAGVKSIVTIEREEFGTDSIEVGLKVFHQWNMPKSYHEIVKNQDFSILNYTEVSDYDRLTRIADILSRKLYSILVSPEENELLETIFRHYKASSEIIDAFGPDYYDNIKDHPYFI